MSAVRYWPAGCVLLVVLAGLQCCSALTIIQSHPEEVPRKTHTHDKRWPEDEIGLAIVHFQITDTDVNETLFKSVLHTFHENICFTFKEMHKGDKKKVSSYLKVDAARHCHSERGYEEGHPTAINLAGEDCGYTRVLHEVGHALGMRNEHNRYDRDHHIIVVRKNLLSFSVGEYKKSNQSESLENEVPYDYTSIMHYGEKASSGNNKRVLLTLDPRFQEIIGTSKELSFMDRKYLVMAYQCSKKWAELCGVGEDACQNFGYVGSFCECECPDGTTGKHCENKKMSYNDALAAKLTPLSAVIDVNGTVVHSPGYPKGLEKGETYVHVFKAPMCYKAVLTFTDFDLSPKGHYETECYFDWVEIRDDVSVDQGPKFCGKDIKAGDIIKSAKSMLILHFSGFNYAKEHDKNHHRGYKAVFTTEPIPGCYPIRIPPQPVPVRMSGGSRLLT